MEAKKTILDKLNGRAASSNAAEQAAERKSQVGSGMRGDKIRTYRFQDDTVKDHITGKSSTCTKILNGYFDVLWF